jgi:hypothetical protein
MTLFKIHVKCPLFASMQQALYEIAITAGIKYYNPPFPWGHYGNKMA